MTLLFILVATQQKRDIDPMLVYCWSTIKPTVGQYLVFNGNSQLKVGEIENVYAS